LDASGLCFLEDLERSLYCVIDPLEKLAVFFGHVLTINRSVSFPFSLRGGLWLRRALALAKGGFSSVTLAAEVNR
jgi:hypothetical protein